MRTGKVSRNTLETNVEIEINLDGTGKSKIATGIGYFDHILTLFARHGQLDLNITCNGDLQVDTHHSVEDVGICLGQAIKSALGNKAQINRYATAFTPMDETLTRICLDFSGRGYLVNNLHLNREFVGDFECEMIEEFFYALAINAAMTLHVTLEYGKNAHHIVESAFKGLGRAIGEASTINDKIVGVLSTKGTL